MTNSEQKIILNAGCGPRPSGRLPAMFSPEKWREIRLDVVPEFQPDIVCSIVDMSGKAPDAAVDVVFSSHAIEHLHAHEVIPAFREFRRVLKPGGFALITCPNLAAIAKFILEQGDEAIAYQAPIGPIRPIDMLFGHSESIANGLSAMAHRTGFSGDRLARIAVVAGFSEARVISTGFDLWALLLTPETSLAEIEAMFGGTDLDRLIVPPQALRPEQAQAAAIEQVAEPSQG